jgi:hypothetical protein
LNQAQENTNEVVNQTERFQQDIYDVAFNGVVQKQQPKELSLQINSIKYSHDCNWGDCASALVPVMMMAAKGNMKELVSTLEFYAEMISQYLPSVTDEEELIFAIQEFCESDRGAEWAAFFKAILWQLYDRETISEEAILKWAREHEDAGEGDCQLLLQVSSLSLSSLSFASLSSPRVSVRRLYRVPSKRGGRGRRRGRGRGRGRGGRRIDSFSPHS